MIAKRSALHLGVNKQGIVKFVKVTAFRDVSYEKTFQKCYRQNLETMHSFECYLPNRSTKHFKKLLDSVLNKDLILAVINEVSVK